MRIAQGSKTAEWVCLCCGKTEVREILRGKPIPGICPDNSTQTEEKPHMWEMTVTF